jgi:hypothetical protein
MGSESDRAGQGELRIAFYDGVMTKSPVELPDTSDFLLTVTGDDGTVIYDGAYGGAPESMMVDPGSYSVFVRSCEFTRPAFSTPQFGDEQCVLVPSDGVVDVKLMCVQLNSGVRLKIDRSFLAGCPDAALFLKSAQGKLMYGYSEKRIAYFIPGTVSLMMSSGGTDKILMTRNLQARTVLEIGVSSASGPSSSEAGERIQVAVDTARTWLQEDYVIGGSSGTGRKILTVAQAKESVGDEDVWISGYIVGGDLTSSSASFESPFFSRTNIVLGPKSSTTSKDQCLSVSLPSGEIRENLNLVDNPSLHGRKVCLRVDIVESYYGITGIRNVSDYELQ